ncbi:TPA: DUF4435 domain-containing protein [Vibrio fluvialis]|nr:DUF4435 domain-containing protein [Vibrio fluvialis]
MNGIVSGAGFPVSSNYVGTVNCFKNEASILVYVEGFEDVSFWNKLFSKAGISVTVEAYGNCNKANGKGTIISAWENGEIELGDNLVVALDSDYDYLLDKKVETFSSDFVFQTYAYSIENLIWHPEQLGFICQDACCNTCHINPEAIKNGLQIWSKLVYPEFLRFLHSNAIDEECFERVIQTLDSDDLTFNYADKSFPSFDDSEFTDRMLKKGLTPYNVYLFVRGHDFADKVSNLCKNIVESVSDIVKSELQKTHEENSGQFIGEYYNKRREPDAVARGKEIQCGFSIPKIIADLALFERKFVKNKAVNSFKKVTVS